ncbi:ankyrin repeat-containing domain protein [Aspergillus transmontanensis]|uniref:Ankyrin repeat-containing domain protein n=1 Tax=Aspergillus transmontanensis TaxID=1034304 RepID=A0A5N6VQR0_9EURO|nr:ankyrin repeat-containing domain protein [Aspergillus transmontanensis]
MISQESAPKPDIMASPYPQHHGIPGPDAIVNDSNTTNASPGGNHVYPGGYKVQNGHMILGNVSAQGDIYIEAQMKEKIRTWLSPLNFLQTQQDLLRKRTQGTGTTLLSSEAFKEWVSSSKGTLLYTGLPGTGKTMQVSIIVDHLRKEFDANNKLGVACVYCNSKDEARQTVDNLLASLWLQLVVARGGPVEDEVKILRQNYDKKHTLPDLDEVRNVLYLEIRRYSKVFLIVDALDELGDETREDFVDELNKLRSLELTVNLLATSRPQRRLQYMLPTSRTVEIHPSQEDLKSYVHSRIKADILLDSGGLSDQEKGQIVDTVVKKSDGIFLLVKLHMDTLRRTRRKDELLTWMNELPDNLDKAFEDTVERIRRKPERQLEVARQILYWLTSAFRYLTVGELEGALALSCGKGTAARTPDDFCEGLVDIDRSSGTVRLIHLTAQVYLEKKQKDWLRDAPSIATTCLESLLTFGHSPSSEERLKEQLAGAPLVVYAAEQWGSHVRQELDWKTEKDANPIKEQAHELLESEKLQCAIKVMSRSQYSLQRRKDVTKLHIVAYFGIDQLLERLLRGKLAINAKDNHGTTALHWAVRNEHKAMVKSLVNNKSTDINAKDNYGRTALHWAAQSANKDIMSLLLQKRRRLRRWLRSRSTNIQDRHGATPLHYAASNAHGTIVGMLLDKGANINKKERGGRTALSRAIENGSEEIVKMLLERKANVNRAYRLPEFEDRWVRYGTILWKKIHALLTSGDEDEAELHWLLAVSIQTMRLGTRIMAPTMQRWDRRHQQREAGGVEEDEESALYTRLFESYQKMGIRLGYLSGDILFRLERPFRKLSRGLEKLEERSELFREVRGPIRLILAPLGTLFYQYYRTPLSRAAERGDLALVTQLLDWPGSHPSQSTFIRTPLSLAAEHGHGSVVKLLVERNADVNFKFMGSRTPLSYAAENGHRDVVEVLLRSNTLDVDPKETYTLRIPQTTDNDEADLRAIFANSKLMNGRTPLSYAAEKGHKEVVEILLVSNKVDVNSMDGQGLTPLSYAEANGHEEVVAVLQGWSNLQPN